MKFYFIVIIICIIFIYISFRSNKKIEKNTFLKTAKCSYCGLVFPSNEAIFDSDDRVFVVMNTKKKSMKLDNGFYLGAKWKKSPNFNSRPSSTTISLIVIHSISLPAGVYSGKYVENFFCNDFHKINEILKVEPINVSSHFFIRRNGFIVQFVNTNDRAWHAGHSSFRGKDNCNDFSIGIELEGVDNDFLVKVNIYKLIKLIKCLALNYPIENIASHKSIALPKGRKMILAPILIIQDLRLLKI